MDLPLIEPKFHTLKLTIGELYLKGKNKYKYEKILLDNINEILGQEVIVKPKKNYILINPKNELFDKEYMISKIQKIPGISKIIPCIIINNKKVF